MPSKTAPPLIALLIIVVLFATAAPPLRAQDEIADGNKPERLEWFRDLGFGLFIHWNLESQISSVISHSLVGAERDFVDRLFHRVAAHFQPEQIRPR